MKTSYSFLNPKLPDIDGLERRFYYNHKNIKKIVLGNNFFNGSICSLIEDDIIELKYNKKNEKNKIDSVKLINFLYENFNDRLYMSGILESEKELERYFEPIAFEKIKHNKFKIIRKSMSNPYNFKIMPIENLASVSFTQEELTKIDNAIKEIESVLKGKTLNLTPEERQQHGRIAEQNKLFVNKGKELMDQYPQYIPTFLDKAEFDKDFLARTQIETRLTRLQGVVEQLSDTKTLLDHDNYHATLTFYQHIKYLSQQSVAGISTIYEALKQFFKGGRKKNTPTEPTETSTQA